MTKSVIFRQKTGFVIFLFLFLFQVPRPGSRKTSIRSTRSSTSGRCRVEFDCAEEKTLLRNKVARKNSRNSDTKSYLQVLKPKFLNSCNIVWPDALSVHLVITLLVSVYFGLAVDDLSKYNQCINYRSLKRYPFLGPGHAYYKHLEQL